MEIRDEEGEMRWCEIGKLKEGYVGRKRDSNGKEVRSIRRKEM